MSWRRAPVALLLAQGLALGACANILGIEEAVEGAGGMPGGDGTGGTTATMSCAAGGTCSDGAVCLGLQCCQPPAAGGVCNVPACGCSLAQVCYPDTMATGLACFSSTGARAGQDCRDGVCVVGLGCFGGLCRPYCRTDADCPGPAGLRHCQPTYWGDDAGTMIAGVNVCARMCDPLRPQSPRPPLIACPAGFICDWSDEDGTSNCIHGGTGTEGAACVDQTDCSPGYFCSTNGSVCHKICADSTDCGGGLACLDFSPAVTIGNLKVGPCARPMASP